MADNNVTSLASYRERLARKQKKRVLDAEKQPAKNIDQIARQLSAKADAKKTVRVIQLERPELPDAYCKGGYLLFLPCNRDETDDVLRHPGPHLADIVWNASQAVAMVPSTFPNYGHVNPEHEAMFRYGRERKLLEYQAMLMYATMDVTSEKRGIMLAKRKHTFDLKLIDDAREDDLTTRLSVPYTCDISLANQYIDELLTEKLALPWTAVFRRRDLNRQVRMFMREEEALESQVPAYRQLLDKCRRYIHAMLETVYSEGKSLHNPIPLNQTAMGKLLVLRKEE
ncbi:hypothetical protein KY363_00890 [Candidatus Woesearchaeota archaeon]|nr:hypothetical protein [Candidatus Woesearchaeota archaeon]